MDWGGSKYWIEKKKIYFEHAEKRIENFATFIIARIILSEKVAKSVQNKRLSPVPSQFCASGHTGNKSMAVCYSRHLNTDKQTDTRLIKAPGPLQ